MEALNNLENLSNKQILDFYLENPDLPSYQVYLFYLLENRTLEFEEVKEILENEEIKIFIRQWLAKKVKKLDFEKEEIKEFLKNKDINSFVRNELALRINELEFNDEVKEFLESEDINWKVRWNLAKRIKNLKFNEKVKDFLKNKNIDSYVREKLALRLNNLEFNEEVKEFLEGEDDKNYINRSVRANLAKRVKKLDFEKEEVKDFLKNEDIDPFVRAELALRINKLDFSDEVKEFLKNENIYWKVRANLAKRVKKLDFEKKEVKDFLKKKKINSSVRARLALRINELEFSEEVKEFLKNENIYWRVRANLAKRVKKLDFEKEEVKEFLKNDKIDFKVREALASIIIYNKPKSPFKNLDIYNKKYSKKVNKYQNKLLFPDKKIKAPEKRTLILYIRENQWAYIPHLEIIVPVLKEYVKKYSKVWNNFDIQTRFWKIDSIANEKINYREEIDFKSYTTVYADTIHLFHWNPEYDIAWTHFILWDTIIADKRKIDKINKKNYTRVWLSYHFEELQNKYKKNIDKWNQKNQNDKIKYNEIWFPLEDMEKIIETLISSLQKAEKQILENAWLDVLENIDSTSWNVKDIL